MSKSIARAARIAKAIISPWKHQVGLGALVGFLVSKAPGPRRYQLGRKRDCWETKIAMDNDSFIDDLFDLPIK